MNTYFRKELNISLTISKTNVSITTNFVRLKKTLLSQFNTRIITEKNVNACKKDA